MLLILFCFITKKKKAFIKKKKHFFGHYIGLNKLAVSPFVPRESILVSFLVMKI